MTDAEQNNYADMLAMLDRIHRWMETGIDIDGNADLFNEIGCLIARARGEYIVED